MQTIDNTGCRTQSISTNRRQEVTMQTIDHGRGLDDAGGLEVATAVATWLAESSDEALQGGHAPPGEVQPQKVTKEKQGNANKGEKHSRADRAAETLYRIVYQRHERLSTMADAKAHVMITLCAALSGVASKQLFDPLLRYAAGTLIASCMLAATFAVFSTVPWLPASRTTDPNDSRFNLLFFGQFCGMPPDVFQQQMERLGRDRVEVHRALARDLHALGTVLGRKQYRYLRCCYWTFLSGLALSLVVLAATAAGARP